MHVALFLSYNLNKDLISTLGWVSWAEMYLLSSAIIGTKYSVQVGTGIRIGNGLEFSHSKGVAKKCFFQPVNSKLMKFSSPHLFSFNIKKKLNRIIRHIYVL